MAETDERDETMDELTGTYLLLTTGRFRESAAQFQGRSSVDRPPLVGPAQSPVSSKDPTISTQ